MTNRSQTRAVQNAVAELGHDPGPIDGQFGAKTAAGVRSWLDAEGEPKVSAILGDAPIVQVPTVLSPNAGRQIKQGAAGYVVDHVMLHTSATPGGWSVDKSNAEMLADIRSWHLGNGWSDIGYHFVVFPDGAVLPGRRVTRIGAGCVGFNRGVIHICMIPVKTISTMGAAEDFYTPQSISGVRVLMADLARQTPLKRLSGHNEHAAKLCPGFRVHDADWIKLTVA